MARHLQTHGDMASCDNRECRQARVCWRAQKPWLAERQPVATFEGGDNCTGFIAIAATPSKEPPDAPRKPQLPAPER